MDTYTKEGKETGQVTGPTAGMSHSRLNIAEREKSAAHQIEGRARGGLPRGVARRGALGSGTMAVKFIRIACIKH